MAVEVAVAAILMQQVKDNLLAPRLLGNFIGLNPIWIFVAILMGYEIAGLLGTLVAVPIAGTIKGTFDAIKSGKLVLLKALSMRSRAASQMILYQLSLFPMIHLQIKGATGTETGGFKTWFSFRSPMLRL